jgi:hypothetical protein
MPQPPLTDSESHFGQAVALQLSQVAQHLLLEHSKSLSAKEQNFECVIAELREENASLRHRLRALDVELEHESNVSPPRMESHVDEGVICSEHCSDAVGTKSMMTESELPAIVAIGSPVRRIRHDTVVAVGSPVISPERRRSSVSPVPSSKISSPIRRRLQYNFGSLVEFFQVWPELLVCADERHPPTVDFCPDDVTRTPSAIAALESPPPVEVTKSQCTLCRLLVASPSSSGRLAWEIFGIPLLAYDLVFIPMQIFDIPSNTFYEFMSWTSMLYWTCDLVGSFFVGYYTSDGKLVMEWCRICLQYLKFGFWMDLAVVSIDWLLVAINSMGSSALETMGFARIGKMLRILRIFRVLRLLRLRKLRHLIQAVQDRIDSEYLVVVVNIAKNMAFIIMASHFVACLWFFVGSQKFTQWHSWVEVYLPGEGVPWEYQYMTSLHWAICQFTPGSMKVQPQNVIERLFAVLMLLCSLLVFSMFISSLTNAMRTLQDLGSKDARQLWLLRKFFRQNGISRDLTLRIMRYANVVLLPQQHRVQQSDIGMLSRLSSHLRVELQTELNMPNLTVHPFFEWFSGKSLPVIRRLCCVATKRTYLSREDVIFGPGQKAVEMYFPLSGQLSYHPQRETYSHTVVSKGQWCSEAVLWCPWVHHGTLHARVESELLALNAAKFREVVTEHYIDLSYAQAYGHAFVQCLNDAATSAVQIGDLCTDFLQAKELMDLLSS